MKRRYTRSPWKMVRIARDRYVIDYGPYPWNDYGLTKRQALAFIRFAIAEERGQ